MAQDPITASLRQPGSETSLWLLSDLILNQWYLARVDFALQVPFGKVLPETFLAVTTGGGELVASRGWRARLLLNAL
jgi:hypothetical protein